MSASALWRGIKCRHEGCVEFGICLVGSPGAMVDKGRDGNARCGCDACTHTPNQSCRHGWLATHCPWRHNERAPMGACGKGETK